MRQFTVLIAVALGGLSCGGPAQNAPGSHTRMSASAIYKMASPAIVRIEVGDDKMGTGFIVDKTGLVATNRHVIAGATKIKIHTYNRGDYWVQSVAAVDKEHDLALVRINVKSPLPSLPLGDSNQLTPGDMIYTIGNPLGLFDYSISDGLISAVRAATPSFTMLQISAPISPGSSGGPLFNQYGEVVGVARAIIVPTNPHVTVENINFAIPANYIKPMLKQPGLISLEAFAKDSQEHEAEEEDHGEASDAGEADVDTAVPQRHIPNHEVTLWAGCKPADIEETFKQIESAIELGAPIYNQGVNPQIDTTQRHKAFEECFRIYEGTGLRLEQAGACKGVRDAFGDGLLRASAINSYKDKAWAMRDTFDGLIFVAAKWCNQSEKTCAKDMPGVHKVWESIVNQTP